MQIDNWLLLIATIVSFIEVFINAVVGSGGLMQMPLLLILFSPLRIHN